MGIRAVFSKVAGTCFDEELANLSFVVVVRDLEHLVLDFKRQLLVTPSKFMLAVSEVTAGTLRAGVCLHKMLAKGRLV